MTDSSMSDMSATGMTSSSMMMTFFTGKGTALFSSDWVPSSTGAYAGTCIFIIILAFISRLISITKHSMEKSWQRKTLDARSIIIAGRNGELERLNGKEKPGSDNTLQFQRTQALSRYAVPFRLSVDVPRALMFTLQAGLGYLLYVFLKDAMRAPTDMICQHDCRDDYEYRILLLRAYRPLHWRIGAWAVYDSWERMKKHSRRNASRMGSRTGIFRRIKVIEN